MMRGTAGWALLAIVVVLGYVTVNTLRTEGPGSRGVPAGTEVPPFAAPLALANVKCRGGTEECDVNVLLKANDGVPKACDTRGEDILNSCELVEDGPLVLAFMATLSDRCIGQIGLVDSLQERFPDVQFAAVAIKGDHGDLNDIIRRERWTLPVAYDHDGILANMFAIAVCPTITFADRGGEVRATTIGTASEAEIAANVRALR